MATSKIDLYENESIINNWALNYMPPIGGKYNGNCIINAIEKAITANYK